MPSSSFERNVFISSPLDNKYRRFLDPMLFTIVYLGLNPQIVQNSDSDPIRIEKILSLMKGSKYSIHDLSKLDETSTDESSNLSLELGLDLGIKTSSRRSKLSTKVHLILDQERSNSRYRKALSDWNYIEIYGDSPERLVLVIRNWFTTIIHPKQPSGSFIWEELNEFWTYFESYLEKEGYSKKDIESLPLTELIFNMKKWVKSRKVGGHSLNIEKKLVISF